MTIINHAWFNLAEAWQRPAGGLGSPGSLGSHGGAPDQRGSDLAMEKFIKFMGFVAVNSS